MTRATYDPTDYYRDQLDKYRRAETECQERVQRQEEERRRQRERDWEQEQHAADTWPEALRKAKILYRREANFAELEGVNEPADEVTCFFRQSANACAAALELWSSEEAEAAATIADLQRQIADIRSQIARAVSVKLRIADQSLAAMNLAQALYDIPESPEYLTEWLNW